MTASQIVKYYFVVTKCVVFNCESSVDARETLFLVLSLLFFNTTTTTNQNREDGSVFLRVYKWERTTYRYTCIFVRANCTLGKTDSEKKKLVHVSHKDNA